MTTKIDPMKLVSDFEQICDFVLEHQNCIREIKPYGEYYVIRCAYHAQLRLMTPDTTERITFATGIMK